MRRLLTTAIVLAGCRGQAECTETSCAEVCEAATERRQADVPDGGVVLSAYEATVLGATIMQLRRGIQLADVDSFGLCSGTSRDCDRFVQPTFDDGRAVTFPEPLDRIPWRVWAELAVPSVGSWELDYELVCTAPDMPERREARTIRLSGQGEPIRKVTFGVVSPAPVATEQSCGVFVRHAGDDGPAVFDLQFTIAAP